MTGPCWQCSDCFRRKCCCRLSEAPWRSLRWGERSHSWTSKDREEVERMAEGGPYPSFLQISSNQSVPRAPTSLRTSPPLRGCPWMKSPRHQKLFLAPELAFSWRWWVAHVCSDCSQWQRLKRGQWWTQRRLDQKPTADPSCGPRTDVAQRQVWACWMWHRWCFWCRRLWYQQCPECLQQKRL